MESDVELAIHHAVDLAKARGKPLASVTLRGAASAAFVEKLARGALMRLGAATAEVRFEHAAGRVELASLELA